MWDIPQQTQAQDLELGFKVGLTAGWGSHFQRIGLSVNVFGHYDFVQVNAGTMLFYSFKNLGPPLKTWEIQNGLGGLVSWGKKVSYENPNIALTGNQTQRPFALAYAYLWYFDQIESSHTGGTFAIHLRRWKIEHENDIFAGKGHDGFRTGAFSIAYFKGDLRFALSNINWTGDPKFKGGSTKIKGTKYPARFGYIDMNKAKYGNYSHGILSLQVDYFSMWRQSARAALGIDADQIRHAIQNKLIHDMPFVPPRWNTADNPHYPMLDENGQPYLFDEGQKIRKPKLYYGLWLNPSPFY